MSDLEESSDGSIFDEPYVPPTREQSKQQEAEFDNDAAYRAQFDRNSSQFHQGDTTLVPTGGSRVPDHMKDHSNWRSLPEVDMKPIDPNEFGPEYAAVFNKREEYNHLKKVVNGVLPHIAALVKNRASLEILKTEERREAIQKLIESNTAKQLEALKEFSVQMKKWEGSPFDRDFATIFDLASNLEISADGNQLLNERVKRVSAQILLRHNALLQEMKGLKNEYLKKTKN